MNGDLRDDVRSGAEAVYPNPRTWSRHSVRPVADQAGTQKGRRMRIIVTPWQREAERGIGNGVLRVAAVDLIARVSTMRA
jgi:hypothetical protein